MDINDIISSGLLELYATGLASAEETLQVQDWALAYPEVADELKKIENSLDVYMDVHSMPPSPEVKDKIFLRINETEPAKVIPITAKIEDNNVGKVRAVSPFWRNVAAAAVVLLIGSIISNVILISRNNNTAVLLENTQRSLAVLEKKNEGIEQDMQVVQSKYSQPVSLNGLEAAPEAAAKVFWMKNTGEIFIDPTNLPKAPQGKRYELWAFIDGKPVNAGIIITSKQGDTYRIQKMKTFGKVEAFAVSLEEIKDQPATSPLGPVLVMGKI